MKLEDKLAQAWAKAKRPPEKAPGAREYVSGFQELDPEPKDGGHDQAKKEPGT